VPGSGGNPDRPMRERNEMGLGCPDLEVPLDGIGQLGPSVVMWVAADDVAVLVHTAIEARRQGLGLLG